MVEKAVIVHKSIVENWAKDPPPFLSEEDVKRALAQMSKIELIYPPENIIRVEESPNTGFTSLPDKVGPNNSARLYGARAAYCLRKAREVLEQAGILVTLDNLGCLP